MPYKDPEQKREYDRQHYRRNRERKLKYQREYSRRPEVQERNREYKRRWQREYSKLPKAQEQIRAGSFVNNGIASGEVPHVSTQVCADCQGQADHYHHEDYSKPLEVVALCIMCHNARHRKEREAVT